MIEITECLPYNTAQLCLSVALSPSHPSLTFITREAIRTGIFISRKEMKTSDTGDYSWSAIRRRRRRHHSPRHSVPVCGCKNNLPVGLAENRSPPLHGLFLCYRLSESRYDVPGPVVAAELLLLLVELLSREFDTYSGCCCSELPPALLVYESPPVPAPEVVVDGEDDDEDAYPPWLVVTETC